VGPGFIIPSIYLHKRITDAGLFVAGHDLVGSTDVTLERWVRRRVAVSNRVRTSSRTCRRRRRRLRCNAHIIIIISSSSSSSIITHSTRATRHCCVALYTRPGTPCTKDSSSLGARRPATIVDRTQPTARSRSVRTSQRSCCTVASCRRGAYYCHL